MNKLFEKLEKTYAPVIDILVKCDNIKKEINQQHHYDLLNMLKDIFRAEKTAIDIKSFTWDIQGKTVVFHIREHSGVNSDYSMPIKYLTDRKAFDDFITGIKVENIDKLIAELQEKRAKIMAK